VLARHLHRSQLVVPADCWVDLEYVQRDRRTIVGDLLCYGGLWTGSGLRVALSYEWALTKNIHDLAQKPMLEVPKV